MAIVTRRAVLRTLAATPAAMPLIGFPHVARAAEFELKYGNNLPLSHPLNIRAQEAAERVARESKGRVEIKIFPNNQLGGDTDMLSQVRNGGITFFTPSALVIATLVPVAAINAVGFAFSDYDQVWKAMDGKLGAHVREAIAKVNLFAFEKMWDNGFRQMTTSGRPIEQAKDMAGLKIRVPVSPLSISMFKALDAAPASLQFSEVYTALQTRCRSSRWPSSSRSRRAVRSRTISGTGSGSSPTGVPGAACRPICRRSSPMPSTTPA